MKNIAILVAHGFEEIELSAPLDILRRFRFNVVTAGVGGTEIEGAHQLVVKTDTTLDELDADKLDAIILPGGGGGAAVLRDTPEVIELIQAMHKSGKLVAAICAAPIALAKAGIIAGRSISAYPDPSVFEELSTSQITGDLVTVDGHIITGKGPAAALAFGYAIASYLGKKREDIADMKKAMIYTDIEI